MLLFRIWISETHKRRIQQPLLFILGFEAGADDIVPSLAYVILKSNPPLLKANLDFMFVFAQDERIAHERAGYCLLPIYCIHFILYFKDTLTQSLVKQWASSTNTRMLLLDNDTCTETEYLNETFFRSHVHVSCVAHVNPLCHNQAFQLWENVEF